MIQKFFHFRRLRKILSYFLIQFDFLLRGLSTFAIYLYQVFGSTFFVTQNCCLYEESCSTYSIRVLKENNILKAFYLLIKRVLSCNSIFKKFEHIKIWRNNFGQSK